MNKLIKINTLIVPCLLLAACGGSTDDTAKKDVSENVVVADKNYNSEPREKAVSTKTSAADAPALGTDIADVIKADSKATATTTTKAESADKGYQDVLWDDLVPEGFQPNKIIERYQAQIQAAAEGSKEERELYDKVMGEINSAGANKALNGKTIRIPGYVAPLDTTGDLVGNFLLVPYYGSCIHSPPPPAHQTVLVEPAKGKSVSLNDIYRPVWVIGEIGVEEIDTDLAKAGYQMLNARVVPYTQPAH